MIYKHRIALLEAENDGLKAVKARDEHIVDSLHRLCSFWSTSTNLLHHPHSPWWKFWKISDPAMLEFPPAIPGRS